MFNLKDKGKLIFLAMCLLLTVSLILTGCSNNGNNDNVVQTSIDTLEELNDALNSNSTEVIVEANITGDAEINNRTDDLLLNLNGKTLTGNLKVNQPDNTEEWTFSIQNGTIDGNLTIDDPAITVIVGNDVEVTGTTNINNVSENTFNNKGNLGTEAANLAVYITDNDGCTFNNTGTINGTLSIASSDSSGAVNLEGDLTSASSVEVTGNNGLIKIKQGTQVTTIEVTGDNNGIEIEDTGITDKVVISEGTQNNNVNEITLEAPTISPSDDQLYNNSVEVSIEHSNSNATIYYTTDGSEPTPNNGTEYAGPFTLNSDTIVKAKAYVGNEVSPVAEATYQLDLPATGSISGTITYSGTVEGAVVAALEGSANLDTITSYQDLMDVVVESTTAATNGSYIIEGLTEGSYKIVAYIDINKNGELDFANGEPTEPNGCYEDAAEEPIVINLSAGEDKSDINFTLWANVLEVEVFNTDLETETENAVVGATVYLVDENGDVIDQDETQDTGSDRGLARLVGLVDGDSYYIRVEDNSYVTALSPIFEYGAGMDQESGPIEIEVFAASFINETVFADGFDPDKGRVLVVFDSTVAGQFTGESGMLSDSQEVPVFSDSQNYGYVGDDPERFTLDFTKDSFGNKLFGEEYVFGVRNIPTGGPYYYLHLASEPPTEGDMIVSEPGAITFIYVEE